MYFIQKIVKGSNVEIESVCSNLMRSIAYVIKEGNSVIVIDPNGEEKKILEHFEIAPSVEYILLTHEHCDHCAGAARLRKDYGCEILVSRLCAANLMDERMNYSRYFEALVSVQTKINNVGNVKMDPFVLNADIVYDKDMTLNWHGHKIYLRHTPGHSKGSSCILIDNKYLFSGDSIIWNEKTITRFLGGSKKEFEKNTVPWLNSLNPEIHVFPGHLEEFRLGERLKEPII